jgi:uncharacterized protein YdeI (YjbR/CyaY-like superfamily)
MADLKPTFFVSAAKFRQWLEKNHDKKAELLVGFYKKDSGKKSISYPEAVDEALCFGWIDGVRRRVDDESYCNRFSPRRPNSIWSVVNTKRMKELIDAGRVAEPGLAAFSNRDPKRTQLYSFENRPKSLEPSLEKRFRANKKAWQFFEQQPPGYKKIAIFFVMSAKQDETRVRRLDQLISISSRNERLGLISSKKS